MHIKNSQKEKKTFVLNINNNDSNQRRTTSTSLYIHRAKKCAKHLYLYTKRQILFKKQVNLRCVFIHKKPDNLRYGIFHELFEIGIYINI